MDSLFKYQTQFKSKYKKIDVQLKSGRYSKIPNKLLNKRTRYGAAKSFYYGTRRQRSLVELKRRKLFRF